MALCIALGMRHQVLDTAEWILHDDVALSQINDLISLWRQQFVVARESKLTKVFLLMCLSSVQSTSERAYPEVR